MPNSPCPWIILTFHSVHHSHGLPKQLLGLCLDVPDTTALLAQCRTLAQPVLQLCILSLESLKALGDKASLSTTMGIMESPKHQRLAGISHASTWPSAIPRG